MSKPKLGISYNVFDGEEILPYAVSNLRSKADYIVVIYQTKSNYGNDYKEVEVAVNELKEKGLVDEVYHYEPEILMKGNEVDFESGWKNEICKRNIGLELCRENGCDYYMTLDCDELYDHKEFDYAFNEVIKNDHDTSFSLLRTFYKDAEHELSPPEKHYQPFIYKIREGVYFEFNDKYPVFVDGTKRMETFNPRIFKRDEIEQYHYAYVRNNIRRKVENSSAQTNKQMKESVIFHYDNWKSGDVAYMIGLQMYNLVKVKNKFGIKI
mgnify:CR=1 FL=1